MDVSFYIGGVFAVLLGLCLGSFANVLVIRMKEATTLWGRSHCPSCHATLRPQHLVPVISWLVLRGKCADCGKPIHIQYPIVEGLGAVLVLAAYLRHPFLIHPAQVSAFMFESFFMLDLLVLAVFDFRWKLLPIEFIVGSAVFFTAWSFLLGQTTLLSAFLGFLIGAGFLEAQVLMSGGKWMGSGDPWMGGMIGAVLGWPLAVTGLYFTYVCGGVFALLLLSLGAVKRGARIPFGPLLAGGAILAVWYGPFVIRLVSEAWYGRV